MTQDKSLLARWRGACDPAAPATVDQYIDFDAWVDPVMGKTFPLRGRIPPIARLQADIEMAEQDTGQSTHLFAGFRGAGKSTELARLGRALNGTFTVLHVDAGSYKGVLTGEPEIVEFALTLAAAIGGCADDVIGAKVFGGSGILGRVESFLKQDVEIEKMGVSFAGFSIGAALRGNATFQHQLRDAFLQRPERMREFFHETVAKIRAAAGRPVVILVDGLEKPNAPIGEISNVYRAMARLYAEQSDWLRLPGVHTVYCVPPLVPVLEQGVGSAYSSTVQPLPSVKLRDRPPGRAPNAPAERALIAVLERRGVDLNLLFGADVAAAARTLVRASGGHVRHLLEDARALFVEASIRGVPLSDADVQEFLLAQHGQYNISTRHLGRLLLRVDEGGALTELDDDELTALAWALDQYLVLSYANGETWYDVHPRAAALLREARASAGATEAGKA